MIEPETYTLTNRRGQTFYGHLYKADRPQGVAVIQHGFTGAVIEEHIQAMIAAYLDNGYTVLAPDCTNSFNDAEGRPVNCTLTTHLQDLEDTIAWAKQQLWFRTPFALAGHSLGAIALLVYAEANPGDIIHLFPAAPPLNGPLFEEASARNKPESYYACKEMGRAVKECGYISGESDYISWVFYTDMHHYDVLKNADKLNMPTLLIVGEQDEPCPPEHQQKLYDALPGAREMHIIEDADHCYQPKISEMQTLLDNWLQKQKATTADAG